MGKQDTETKPSKGKKRTFVLGVGVLVLLYVFALATSRVYTVLHRAMPAGLADVETVRWLDEMGRIARKGSILIHDSGFDLGMEPVKYLLNTAFSNLFNPFFWQQKNYTNIKVNQDRYNGVLVSTYTPVHSPFHQKDHENHYFERDDSRPSKCQGHPTIIYFHGGGWTWLSVGVYDGPLKLLANSTQFKVIAVEYRKAPQHPFPAPYDDCLAVTKYVVKHARDLNVCKEAIVLAGDGAGGNLAASVSNEMSGLIRLQILINPALQMMNFATPSYQDFSSEESLLPGITSARKEIGNWIRYGDLNPDLTEVLSKNEHISLDHYSFLSHYVDSRTRLPEEFKDKVSQKHTIHNAVYNDSISREIDELMLDSRFNPMLAADIRNVAETYIITSQYDVLRDEALMYGHRLKENGVKVTMQHYWHGFHGFFLFAGGGWIELSESKKAMMDLIQFLQSRVLEGPK